MTRPSLGRAGLLCLLLLAGADLAPAVGQSTEGILAPGGRLRFDVGLELHMWDDRFGRLENASGVSEEVEPLEFDLERGPIADAELGSIEAEVLRERNVVTLGAAVGVFDWLTLGVDVPLVQSRTEITFDYRAEGETPLTQEELLALLTSPTGPFALIRPVDTFMLPYEPGDVEVTAALRLLEGAARDSTTTPARFRYRFGVTALVRLPTGASDHPDVPLDGGSGDGQLDVEVGGFADLRWRRLGLEAEAHRGMQQSVELVRRVAPPEVVMAPLATRRTVRWTPGSYLELEVTPRWHLTDEFALGALVRRFAKDPDEYEEVTSDVPDEAPWAADVLGQETQATLTEVGLGLAYSTVTTWREGRARLPLDLQLAVRKAVAGSGGATPKGLRLEASGRAFVRLWGASPTPAP
jgi:hypothetical protein